MHTIVIYHNPRKNEYYYKIVKGYYRKYAVGQKNRYGHIILLVIEYKDIYKKPTLLRKVIKKLISFLQNIEKKI